MSIDRAPDTEFIDFQTAVAGRYSLERELGRGGMGIVYLAREVRLARAVAIKLLPRALASTRPALRERFLREAQMAAQLSHPNIVPIHHVDEVGDFVFFVMAYVEGQTLGERLRERGPMKPTEAARMLREIGWALAYAHLRGIVHRDVKPDNILLDRESGRAMVTDFGIAGETNSPSVSDGGFVRGTVHFLSPEQAAGEPVDARSDIYSLGVVGYCALTGRLPFEGATPAAVMVQHLSTVPAPIARAAPAVPRRLAEAVERCLEKLPENRWSSGEELAAAVDAAFEPHKEIALPLRVWLAQGDRDVGARVGLAGLTVLITMPLMLRGAVVVLPIGAALCTLLVVIPELARTRKLLASGFTLQDMRTAMQAHIARRREELAYELRGVVTRRTWATLAAVSAATAAAASIASSGGLVTKPLALFAVAVGAITAVLSTVALIFELVRVPRVNETGTRALQFWNSKWADRLVRLAGLGLKRTGYAATNTGMPQLTEVAIGRATDALFAALPKQLRKELKGVPDAVRRLETDAQALRHTLDTIDDALATARRAAREAPQTLLGERERVTEKLGATVAALEGIRLGLLRLRIGAAPLTSVTEALEAARRIGREIDIVGEADAEAQRALRQRLGPLNLANTPS